MQQLIRLDHEAAFTRAKKALVELWNNRATIALHEIEIREHKSKRSNEQNNLMWVILTDISQQVKPDGNEYSPETWHEYFKATILGRSLVQIDGKEVWISKSTTQLNVAEFSDYITQIQAWAVDHGMAFG